MSTTNCLSPTGTGDGDHDDCDCDCDDVIATMKIAIATLFSKLNHGESCVVNGGIIN